MTVYRYENLYYRNNVGKCTRKGSRPPFEKAKYFRYLNAHEISNEEIINNNKFSVVRIINRELYYNGTKWGDKRRDRIESSVKFGLLSMSPSGMWFFIMCMYILFSISHHYYYYIVECIVLWWSAGPLLNCTVGWKSPLTH